MITERLSDHEMPGSVLEHLIAAEIDALSDLKALLSAGARPLPSALTLQVAICNRRRLRTIARLEQFTGDSLRRVTPAALRSAGSSPGDEGNGTSNAKATESASWLHRSSEADPDKE